MKNRLVGVKIRNKGFGTKEMRQRKRRVECKFSQMVGTVVWDWDKKVEALQERWWD